MFQEIINQFRNGDIFMLAILLTSFFGVAIIFERARTLWLATSIDKEQLLNNINAAIIQGQLEKAIAITAQIKNPMTNIIRSGLNTVANNGTAEEVQTAMDAAALKEVPRIEKRIGLLATLSNIATLLGLLGTVSGLIGAFAAVANTAPAEKATMLSNAIAQAMNTTAFGLIVAIPLLGAFGYMNSIAQNVIDDIHESSVATLNFILSNKEKIKKSHG